MKCKCNSELPPDHLFAINDTQELAAKRLLIYFWETFETLEELLYRSETVQAIYALLEQCETKNIPKQARAILEGLPWEVCECFYRFLSECPHVHVTID